MIFYNLEKFKEHLNSLHAIKFTEKVISICKKCQKTTNLGELCEHLVNCHNIKKFHCLWCDFGAELIGKVRNYFLLLRNLTKFKI